MSDDEWVYAPHCLWGRTIETTTPIAGHLWTTDTPLTGAVRQFVGVWSRNAAIPKGSALWEDIQELRKIVDKETTTTDTE